MYPSRCQRSGCRLNQNEDHGRLDQGQDEKAMEYLALPENHQLRPGKQVRTTHLAINYQRCGHNIVSKLFLVVEIFHSFADSVLDICLNRTLSFWSRERRAALLRQNGFHRRHSGDFSFDFFVNSLSTKLSTDC